MQSLTSSYIRDILKRCVDAYEKILIVKCCYLFVVKHRDISGFLRGWLKLPIANYEILITMCAFSTIALFFKPDNTNDVDQQNLHFLTHF